MRENSSRAANWPEGVPQYINEYKYPLFSILDSAAFEYPDAVYTIFNGAKRTFADVKEGADRVASFLISKGIEQGDKVAIILPNIPQYPEVFFGILKAGAVCVACNPMFKSSELNFQLQNADTKAVFVMDHHGIYTTALEAMEGTGVKTVVICNIKSYLPRLKGFLGSILGSLPKAKEHDPAHFQYDSIVNDSALQKVTIDINPELDDALILYTGGTTGTPKGACLSHANLLSNTRTMEEWIRVQHKPGEADTKLKKGGHHAFLGILPWYHSFGLTLCMLTSCITSSKLVCVPDPRAGKPPFTDILKSIEKYKISIMVAVPAIYSLLIDHAMINNFDLSSIVACGSGAAPLSDDVIRSFEEKTGAIIFEGYGLTETSPVIAANPTNREGRKIGTVGFPLPGVDIKIVDIDTGCKELQLGEDGEIAVNGPQVMSGYWKQPDVNRGIFRLFSGKQYLLTGDIGHFDSQGYISITDRKKDLILVSGFNVYPAEIEEILNQNSKVDLAAVVGLPDPKTGESIKAFIQLKPHVKATFEEFHIFCRSRMTGYKCPSQFEFRKRLPMSVIGKVLRRVLKEEELEKL